MNKINLFNFSQILIFQIMVVSFGLSVMPLNAQDKAQNKFYDSSLDSLWSKSSYLSQVSNDGQWVLFTELFDKGVHFTYLASTSHTDHKVEVNGNNHKFSVDSNWFGYKVNDSILVLKNLNNNNEKKVSQAEAFQFDSSGEYVLTERRTTGSRNSIQIIDLDKSSIFQIDDVTTYAINPKNGTLAVSVKHNDSLKLLLVDYRKKIPAKKILKENVWGVFEELTWSGSGNQLVLKEKIDDATHILHYDFQGNQIVSCQLKLNEKYPGRSISNKPIGVSENGDTVFFHIKQTDSLGSNKNIQKWNTKDVWIAPKWNMYFQENLEHKLMLWHPLKSVSFSVGDQISPTTKAHPDVPNALIFDRLRYEPQHMENEYIDLYLKNLRTGTKDLVVKKQYSDPRHIALSPSGRYVAYFKDKNWWLYDSETKLTTNLTQNTEVDFEDKDDWAKRNKSPYGVAGWMKEDSHIIIYDKYDLWLLEINDKTKVRVTKGKEDKITYRINWQSDRNNQNLMDKISNYIGNSYDFNSPIILDMVGDNLKSGFALWKGKSNVKKLIYSDNFKDNLLVSKNKKEIVYREQKVNVPQAIWVLNLENCIPRLLYQSNEKLLKYDLGNFKLISYKNTFGDTMRGMLVYPANYNPRKTYPLMTFIYEKISSFGNNFNPPSDFSYNGFNILRYITNGYFVLLPDINYEIGNPGASALDCVSSAVNEVLSISPIDSSRIGLIGHSFGGYEAAYIATRTELFSAIVAGAPIIDLVSFYHDIAWSWNEEQNWRFENQQLRMGDSYYNMKEQYVFNSPLHHIEDMNTPLFLWAGKDDYNINWYQSVFMYTAMKRLKKEGKFILFENDNHSPMKSENQKMLSKEVFDWFEKYLKL